MLLLLSADWTLILLHCSQWRDPDLRIIVIKYIMWLDLGKPSIRDPCTIRAMCVFSSSGRNLSKSRFFHHLWRLVLRYQGFINFWEIRTQMIKHESNTSWISIAVQIYITKSFLDHSQSLIICTVHTTEIKAWFVGWYSVIGRCRHVHIGEFDNILIQDTVVV